MQHVAIKLISHSVVYAYLDTGTHTHISVYNSHIDYPTRENHDVIFFMPSVLQCSFPVVKVNQLMPPRGRFYNYITLMPLRRMILHS